MKRILFDVPRWHLFLHREARKLDPAAPGDGPHKRFEDELFDFLYSGEQDSLPEAEVDQNYRGWADALHSTCRGLPDFNRLAGQCRGDAGAAATAVESLMEQLKPEVPVAQALPPPSKLRRLVSRACAEASSAVATTQEAAEALDGVNFGWGTGQGTHQPVDGVSYRTLAGRLRNDSRLLDIARLAGRFKRILANKRRQRVLHGADEVTDVEQGAELARLLPAELARLTHPRHRLAVLRDYAERQCLQYQLIGSETLGKGPLVVCLDKSGSMDGTSDVWATALALALLDVARRERRAFALLSFDDGIRHEEVVPAGGELPERALFVSCAGGTDISAAVTRGLDIIESHPGRLRKADIVLVTDGQSDTDEAPALRARAGTLGASILGFGIRVGVDALTPWCDDAHVIRSLDTLDERAAELVVGR